MPAIAVRVLTLALVLAWSATLAAAESGTDSSGGAGTSPPPPPPAVVHEHVLLGVAPAKAPDQLVPALSAPIVGQVVPGSTAAEMGLQVGDTITRIDGAALGGWSALVEALGSRSPGDIITLTVVRGSQTLSLRGALKARSAGAAATAAPEPPP